MKVETMTKNMMLAIYHHTNADKQIVKMARRYRRKCITPSTKKTLRTIINSPMPALLVSRVYDEVCHVSS